MQCKSCSCTRHMSLSFGNGQWVLAHVCVPQTCLRMERWAYYESVMRAVTDQVTEFPAVTSSIPLPKLHLPALEK